MTASATVATVSPASSAAARGGAAFAQADHDVDAGVGEVERVRVALAAVAEHRDLPGEEVDVARLDDLGHVLVVLSTQTLTEGCASRPAALGAAQADPPGADELAHAVRANELFERLELLGAPDDLERDRVAADVRDARAGDLAERDQLGALVGRRADRDQRELALDRLVGPQLGDAQHVDELVHLLLDLLERVLAAVDAQRQPRDVRAARSARPRGSGCCSRAARTAARRAPARPGLFSSRTEIVCVLIAGTTSPLGRLDDVDRGGAPAGTIG